MHGSQQESGIKGLIYIIWMMHFISDRQIPKLLSWIWEQESHIMWHATTFQGMLDSRNTGLTWLAWAIIFHTDWEMNFMHSSDVREQIYM